MGAQTFITYGYGKDLKQAYDNARKDAEEYYGHNPYNGTISTTYGCCQKYGVVDSGTNWTKTKEQKAIKVAYELLDGMENRECKAIDLGKVSNRITHHNGWHKFIFFGWGAC